MAAAGNAWDQSLLLPTLLRDHGFRVRFARGRSSEENRLALLRGLYPPVLPTAGPGTNFTPYELGGDLAPAIDAEPLGGDGWSVKVAAQALQSVALVCFADGGGVEEKARQSGQQGITRRLVQRRHAVQVEGLWIVGEQEAQGKRKGQHPLPHRRFGKVNLTYPRVDLPFSNEVEFLIHQLNN